MMDRFWNKVDKSGECWQWTAGTYHGYGRFMLAGRNALAHRVAWELLRGEIPADQVIDHLCRNRSCVNPDHMELVSAAENGGRTKGLSGRKPRASCPQGHPYEGSNVYLRPDGKGRGCRACRIEAKNKERMQHYA